MTFHPEGNVLGKRHETEKGNRYDEQQECIKLQQAKA